MNRRKFFGGIFASLIAGKAIASAPVGKLSELSSKQESLLSLQLFRAGIPISPETVAKALDLENWGCIEGDTLIEKWGKWRKLEGISNA